MGSVVMTVTIRPLTVDDVDPVVAMEAAHQPSPWSERVVRDEIVAENRVYLAATDEEKVVGFAGIMVVGDEAHVTNLLVVPESRRQGVAMELMLALIDAAIREGAGHLTLEVRTKNDAARSLYARLGMAPVGVRRGYYGDDDALILWAHDISGAVYQKRLESLR